MQLNIDKKAFANLPKGAHSLRVDFKDGFSVGKFYKSKMITFTIMGVVCTATKDMTWQDWFDSYETGSGNVYITRDTLPSSEGGGYLYINHFSNDIYGDLFENFPKTKPSYEIAELALFALDGATSQEKVTNKILDGGVYGLDPKVPR
jgi:uncharacterized membrane protein